MFTHRTSAFAGFHGATHALEITFVFGNLDDSLLLPAPKRNEITTKISEQMMDSWMAFAKTGNPNHDNIPNWPVFNNKDRPTMILGKDTHPENDPLGAERRFWDEIS